MYISSDTPMNDDDLSDNEDMCEESNISAEHDNVRMLDNIIRNNGNKSRWRW